MGDALGETIELDVTNIAHGGVCVARHNGRVVFVSDAIPGERVLARVADDSKPSFWRAETLAVLEPSPHRQPHVWKAAGMDRDPRDRAGGADFGHIELGHQRELKRRVLSDALERMAGVHTEVTVEPVLGDEALSGTGWRTRVSLHVDEAGVVGPYAARSHRVIPVSDLPLASQNLQSIAPLARRFPGEKEIHLVDPAAGPARVRLGGHPSGEITELVGKREFRLAESSFWQVHHGAATVLSGAVQDAIEVSRFDPSAPNLDLYGGVGLLAAAVGDRFGSSVAITSVESNSTASGYAARNLAEWTAATAVTARVERWISELAATSDATQRAGYRGATVVVDPPRSGVGRGAVAAIADLEPVQVAYVGCDPVSLARDVGLFVQRGYRMSRLRAFDLFPNTHHLEAVATLSRE